MSHLFSSNESDHQNFFHALNLQNSRGMPQISKHFFTAKPSFVQQRYADLDIFRQQIQESKAGLHHQPYTMNRRSTTLYKSIFLGFAVLFFILGVTAMAIPSALGCGFFFSSCTLVKGVIVTFCTFLSLSSLTLGLKLRAEKEAIAYYVRKTKAHVATIYARKQVRMGIKSVFALIGPRRQKAAALKQMYDEACDKMNDKKEETLHLVQRISTAETLDKQEKEALLNQAIEEFSEKLQLLTQTFRHSMPSHFSN
jgi:hypothetical protein